MRSSMLATVVLLLSTLSARADTLQTVYVNAAFADDTVSGTLTYDLDDHFIVGGDVTSTGLYNVTWTAAGSTPNSHGTSTISIYNEATGFATPYFSISYVGDGLPVPFEPITICSLTNPCMNFFSEQTNSYVYSQIGTDIATSGYVTPTAPTPEPSSIVLFGSGLLGLAWAQRKRLV